MTQLKNYEAIDRERQEFKKKLEEFLAKEAELKRRMEEGLDLVERSGILEQLRKLADKIRSCRTKIEQIEVSLVYAPGDGTFGSQEHVREELVLLNNAKAELEQLLQEQRRELERLTQALDEVGQKVTISPDDVDALQKALDEAKKKMSGPSAAVQRLEADLRRLKKELKEHGDKGELPKCGAQCKFPEHGLCGNPVVRNGRCWIPDHQAQPVQP